MPRIETGRFETPNGSKYLQQLCKHFAHKVAVEYDPENGAVALPPGPARLTATGDALSVEITAEDDAGLARARHIIDDHLRRFAFREEFAGMNWVPK
ncbi:DUF2218 domain-containing protein [Sedimentitalea sp. JM2-8]|uniref:DUF2218 domain-containing protein n=1 Tax=Sedimentitalea xiamensis TaxID=3050037 RepID=A0ABT7FJN5_9RHOB|nr:DUF2218 domain-containing protein [Sedimentitalea xiamensis]MDK3075347.1 DUF2218 domain-containing protein [Sedimentitalea xiamensis]